MQIMYLVSALYILFFLLVILEAKRIKTPYGMLKLLFFLFALSLANIAFFKNPPSGWDLTSHFNLMNQIRYSNISLYELLFNNPTAIGAYQYFFTYNLIRYVISHITENNHWLPWTMVFIDYCIVGYITVDWARENARDKNSCWISLLICFATMPFIHAVSGMRNALACCFMGLGLYLYLVKHKTCLLFALFSFLSVTVHPSTLICIPIAYISRFNLKKKGLLLIFIIMISIGSIARYLSLLESPFFSLVGKLYLAYSSRNQFQINRDILCANIFLVAMFFILCMIFVSDHINTDKQKIYNFLMYYMCFILGNIGNNDLVIRPVYLLGVLAPLLSELLAKKSLWRDAGIQRFQPILYIVCIGVCLYMVLRYTISFIN